MKKIFSIFCLSMLLYACSKDDSGTIEPDNNYSRNELLTNWANNIIVPSYANYQSKTQILVADVTTFNSNPNIANLQTVRNSWLEAYKAYQYISMFNFGKAEEINIKEATNTYPTDVNGINANIVSGVYNLSLLSQFSKQGLPAIDYLINGLDNSDAVIISFYSTTSKASNYKQYLLAVANKLKFNADLILNDWKSGYKTSYIANNGISVSSSVNRTTNSFVKNFEKDIRTGKLGIPSGVFSSGVKYPEKVEAFYKNDVSNILLKEALKATQDFFNGKHFNSTTTGVGLKSYLDFLNVVRDGKKLSDIINNQFAAINVATNNLNDSFSNQVTNDNSKMLGAYDALQRNVLSIKVDMTQALNITIDYVDGDGD